MRDSGSQSDFISDSALISDNHKVLEDSINLTLNGINQSKVYKSKLVQMNLMFESECKTVELLTLPFINIFLALPGLSTIVSAFNNKCYKFADKILLGYWDKIEDLDMILGVDAAYCFLDRAVPFGELSIFTQTPLGVILYGNIDRMISDLPCLLICSDLSSCAAAININLHDPVKFCNDSLKLINLY